MAKLPEIKFDDLLDDSSTDDEDNFFSPITQPKLISTKKCNDTDCYFCSVIRDDCTGKDISIFKNSSKK